MFNRLITRTSAYKGLKALWESEHKRAEFYAELREESEVDFASLEEEFADLKKSELRLRLKLKAANKDLDTYTWALDVAVADKYRALGSSVALSDEVAYLRSLPGNTDQAEKYDAAIGHLKAMVFLAGKNCWEDGDAETYVEAEDFLRVANPK